MNHLPILLVCAALCLGGCAHAPPGAADAAPPNPPAPESKLPSKPAMPPASSVASVPWIALPTTLQPIEAAQATSSPVAALATPVDLWERIRRGYAMPELDSTLVRDRERWYSSRPDYIQRMGERGAKYLFHIVEELERRNMPSELALLPFVESAFNPQAVSSAKAAGMWQFMPATGKTFELKQNAFRDDRRDVLASTRAALDYLQKLYGMFGDWHLALAAYNWGEGSVARAIAKNQRAGKGLAYTDLSMPMETRFYVPKLQAIKNIVRDPQALGTSLPAIANHPYFQSVDIQRDIDVALAAKLAEVPLEDFKALNPSINRPVILAAGTPQILLPWDNAAVFQSNLEAYGGARLASWTAWLVPTSMKPAEAAKRLRMSEAELRSVNQIPARGVVIRAGSTLVVPRASSLDADVAVHLADHGQIALSSDGTGKRKSSKSARTPARKGAPRVAARSKTSASKNAAVRRSNTSTGVKVAKK